MTAEETLNLVAKQWCTLEDIMKLGHLGRNSALKAKKKIKDKLEKQGYLIPKSVVPTKEVVAFFDIDIPYLESRVSSKKLIKNMLERRYNMKQINEINKSIKKDIIVENLMISNGVYLLVSHPKVGKSMFAQQLAFSLTTGEDFLGFKVNPSHVLYITTEGDINQLNDRFKLMNLKPNVNKLHIIDIDDIPDFYIRDIERDIYELTFDKEPLFIIMDMFKDIKFDTSYDINNYQEINDVVFRKLKELCRKYNSTLLVTHHLNKRDETMGSVGLNADVSGIIKLKESKNNYNKLTLDYKGRDLGRLELNLKRNDNQTFSVIDENTNDETDYNLLLFIKYAVAKKDFDYTISDILSKTNILLTPTQLGGLIQRNLQLLEKEGLHITSKRTANERLWHCSYEEPSENNE